MYNIDEIKNTYMLTDDEFEKMYENVKKVTFLNVKKPASSPIAIMTGGQPGSGKTTGLVLATCREYEDLIVLDMDHYRGFMKKATEIARKYPELYQEITGIYASKILERLSEEVIDGGYNFILEGTMGKSVYTLDLLQQKSTNYKIIARVLAVSREESIFSMFERYLEMKKSMGIGRLTDINSHDIRYINLPRIASSLEGRNVEVEIYERSNTFGELGMLYKTSNPNCSFCKSIQEAIIVGRGRSYIRWKENAQERFNSIKTKMEVLENNPQILGQLNILQNIIKRKDDNEIEI